MIALDTNVLVRYLVEDDVRQAALAAKLIETLCTKDDPGFVNRIVLCEVVWVLESAYGYPRATVADTIDKLLRTAELEIDAGEAAWSALGAYRAGAADFADAFIGRLNRSAGCSGTATFDRAAAKLEDFFTP
ncbi:MAG: PIN domain-containing protein [Kiloniellaceae bacterium]